MRSAPSILLASAALLAQHASAVSWVLSHSMSLSVSRMDPIVDPSGVAGHVHNILGGSAFRNVINSPEQQANSQCSSTNVQADKSNYWAPQLYYRYTDNTLSPMLGSARIYYFNNGPDVVPFPPNLRMISGLTMSRNESDPRAFGLKLSCDHGEQTRYLANKERNPAGCRSVTLGIFFPSCGLASGQLDSEDHFSHMAFPYNFHGPDKVTHGNGWNCPESHPIHYPAIFLEYNYYFSEDQPWRSEDNLIMLSNGDTTGLTFHADFVNGWDQDVLKRAIQHCTVGDRVEDCPPFAPTAGTQGAWDCRLESQIPAEEVGLFKSLPQLPGCNPIWPANMDEKPGCATERDTPGFTYPNVYYRNDKHRSNIPLTVPEAVPAELNNPIRPDIYWDLRPKVGREGASWLKKWGTEAASQYLRVASAESVLKWFVNPDGHYATLHNGGDSAPVPAPAPAPVVSAVAGGTGTGNGNGTPPVDNVDRPVVPAPAPVPSAASSVPAAAPTLAPSPVGAAPERETVTVTIDSCKRKRHVARAGNMVRRSRSGHLRRKVRSAH